MGPLEIFLLVFGFILAAITYIFSEKFSDGGKELEDEVYKRTAKITEELVIKEVEGQLAIQIDDKVEQAEIELDKIINEKIMYIGNYSNDIIESITKNHTEVMFLYNMLNDKEQVLKDTIRDIEALKVSIKKMAVVNDVAKDITSNQLKEENIVKKAKAESDGMDKDEEKAAINVENDINKSENSEKTSLRKRNSSKESNNNVMILELHKEGKSNMEIAKKLGLGIGEVRLVIDLFNKES